MMSPSNATTTAVRYATAAFVLLTALLAIGVAVLVIIGAVQQLNGVAAPPVTTSAWPFLFIVIPLMILAVVVRMRLVGTRRMNH